MNQSDANVELNPEEVYTGSLSEMERGLIQQMLRLVAPKCLIELGVLRAQTSRFICATLRDSGIEGKLFGFDLPETVDGLRQDERVQELESASEFELVPGRLPDSLDEWLAANQQPIDFAFVDAMHNYPSVYGELSRIWPRLSQDGMIVCHDYCAIHDGVRYAVDRFASKHNAQVMPLTSSEDRLKTNSGSVLVALRRKATRPSLSRTVQHRWVATKTMLIRNPLFYSVWRNFLRPIVKRTA